MPVCVRGCACVRVLGCDSEGVYEYFVRPSVRHWLPTQVDAVVVPTTTVVRQMEVTGLYT